MIKDAIETAIKMETDAISFYHEAAEKTKHPFGKEMFQGFVKDETRHLKMLKEILNGMDIPFEFVNPRDSIKTVFSELRDAMMQRVTALKDEMDALDIALRMEKEGFDFYKKTAAAASGREKELFSRLADEEDVHYAVLSRTKNFLEDTGQWFMYEEGGILEG